MKSFSIIFNYIVVEWFQMLDICGLLRFKFVFRLRIWYKGVNVPGFERFGQGVVKTLALVKKTWILSAKEA